MDVWIYNKCSFTWLQVQVPRHSGTWQEADGGLGTERSESPLTPDLALVPDVRWVMRPLVVMRSAYTIHLHTRLCLAVTVLLPLPSLLLGQLELVSEDLVIISDCQMMSCIPVTDHHQVSWNWGVRTWWSSVTVRCQMMSCIPVTSWPRGPWCAVPCLTSWMLPITSWRTRSL